ncbi:uncharacterized protein LOC114570252 [Perca flavescens]|uniref:uncharacterized protein LOC114570252 n=1 Tax=Perca flavescens TaxID=8167 RepID=UPI00106E5B74|nr:uncharacterized protein LOC114570252 [Perca flavescens]
MLSTGNSHPAWEGVKAMMGMQSKSWLSASMLLASVILLLYWTTSSARSQDPTSSILSTSYRVKRDQAFESREKWEKSLAALAAAKDVIPLIKKVIEKIDTKKLPAVMKSLANFASLAPGIGGLIAPFINMALIFIPQDDPVLNEVKKGFEEVNRKLDSISIQISNLETNVEWFNYASVYSQDELLILNAWKKFNDLLQNSQLVKSEEDKLRLAEIYVNYYENTGTEASVANVYHYLTVSDTSLSGNLNKLLRKKFKCDVEMIGKYNVYFSSLLWKGMVLNQFYWKLIGLDSSGIEAEHTKMFKNVSRNQISALEYCLTNMPFVKEDVVRISNGLSDKKAIADKVREFLDNKYNWYNWVVMVYTDEHNNHVIYNMKKIPVGKITVNVGYTQKAEEISKEQVKNNLDRCYTKKYGPSSRQWDVVKMYEDAGMKMPEKDETLCNKSATEIPQFSLGYTHGLYIYYSRNMSPCNNNSCQNGGDCKPLWDTNKYLCECPPSYHGDTCENKIENKNISAIEKGLTVPDITINGKLKKIQFTLDNMRRGR